MEGMEKSLERREFLKRVGIGSVTLASVPFLADVAAAGNSHDRRQANFYFVALSGQADAINRGDSIAMSGCGHFAGSRVRGGGEFTHFDGTKIPSRDFRSTGSWKARRVLSWTPIGTWGVLTAGILDLAIKLLPCDRPAIEGATLHIVCNLSPAGIITMPFQQEGYTLTVPGLAPFKPFTPNIGLTVFSNPCSERERGRGDNDDD